MGTAFWRTIWQCVSTYLGKKGCCRQYLCPLAGLGPRPWELANERVSFRAEGSPVTCDWWGVLAASEDGVMADRWA